MTTYFITRHIGALDWAKEHGIDFDLHLTHLDDDMALKAGDVIIGTLPINIIAKINAIGVRYIHLSLNIPSHLRGVELTSQQLNDECQANLEEFTATKLATII